MEILPVVGSTPLKQVVRLVYKVAIATILVFTTTVPVYAQGASARIDLDAIQFDPDDGWTVFADIRSALLIDSIVGEPKISCSGTWHFIKASHPDHGSFHPGDMPPKVLRKLRLTKLKILYNVSLPMGVDHVYAPCDLGVFYASDSPKPSFNIPDSQNWAEIFQVKNALMPVSRFMDAPSAKRHMQALKGRKKLPTWNHDRGNILEAGFDLSALKQFVKNKDKKKNLEKQASKELEDIFGESGKEQADNGLDDLFEKDAGNNKLGSLEDMLEDANAVAARNKAEREKQEAIRKVKASANQYLGTIETKARTVVITAWDHGSEDGDRVRVLQNDKSVVGDWTLKKQHVSYEFRLVPGNNVIEIKALNQGTSGDNTASFTVNADGQQLASKSWNLSTGANAKLLVIKN